MEYLKKEIKYRSTRFLPPGHTRATLDELTDLWAKGEVNTCMAPHPCPTI